MEERQLKFYMTEVPGALCHLFVARAARGGLIRDAQALVQDPVGRRAASGHPVQLLRPNAELANFPVCVASEKKRASS